MVKMRIQTPETNDTVGAATVNHLNLFWYVSFISFSSFLVGYSVFMVNFIWFSLSAEGDLFNCVKPNEIPIHMDTFLPAALLVNRDYYYLVGKADSVHFTLRKSLWLSLYFNLFALLIMITHKNDDVPNQTDTYNVITAAAAFTILITI